MNAVIDDLSYVEGRIASSETLQHTHYTIHTSELGVGVEVEGAQWEARAWRAVFAGAIHPSYFDPHGTRHQCGGVRRPVVAAGNGDRAVQPAGAGAGGRGDALVEGAVAGHVGGPPSGRDAVMSQQVVDLLQSIAIICLSVAIIAHVTRGH